MSLSFSIASVSSKDLATLNCVFVSLSDESLVRVSEPSYLQLVDGMVYLVRTDPTLKQGTLALNSLQRAVSNVSTGQKVEVRIWTPVNKDIMLSMLRLQVDLVAGKVKVDLNEDDLVKFVKEMMPQQSFCRKQELCVDFRGVLLKLIVADMAVSKFADVKTGGNANTLAPSDELVGLLNSQTSITVELTTPPNKYLNLKRSELRGNDNLFQPNFRFEDMGIGGLDREFGDIFRRAFASRTFPPAFIKKLGIRHVKGILLYGPPGTGKTLIAREIGKMLNGHEPKIVNGPEILNKFVGASEENIRNLFKDAEAEQKEKGDASALHIIIFDEIDAICKQRGTVQSSAGVHDTIVNQMLSKMDGVSALNNVLVIGMTNRKELIDDALLRPGRFEVHIEIGLPDEAGRLQILKIHTKNLKKEKILDQDVDLEYLAANTKNFSGAEIQGLVNSASSFAFNGQIDVTKDSLANLTKVNYEEMKLQMVHFEHALKEVKPAFGVEEEELKKYLRGGFINYGFIFDRLLESCKTLIEQVRNSPRTPLLSVLLQGAAGSGKTALATFLAISSQFPYVKLVSAEEMIGWGEAEKAGKLAKVFRDAYKSPLSIVIVDEIERLLEYVPIGPRFSNTMLQALLILLKKVPPQEGRKLLIIGTTSNPRLINDMDFTNAFNVILTVPQVSSGEEIRTVFEAMQVPIESEDLNAIVAGVTNSIGIKQLLMVIEMANQNANIVTAARFFDCLKDCGIQATETLLDIAESKEF